MAFLSDHSLDLTPSAAFISQNSRIIIAIDGYAGCGKSTTARKVAAVLGYTYIDTGAMYRAVTLHFLSKQIMLTDEEAVNNALADIHISFQMNPQVGGIHIHLNGKNVEEEIRRLSVATLVAEVSAIPAVRRAMVVLQQKLGQRRGVVMDGRDIGTHVFPQAELKIFMTADPLIRAKRRQMELLEKGDQVALDEIALNLKKRDYQDCNRSESPLRQATDALLLDTSFITISEQVDWIVQQANQTIANLSQQEY